MSRRTAAWAVSMAVFAALGLWAGVSGNREAEKGAAGISPASGRSGPEFILEDVTVREVARGGAVNRLEAARASYFIREKSFTGTKVTVTVPGRTGDIVVRAPRVDWDMERKLVLLPEGGLATGNGGWSATVPEARMDMASRVLSADGKSEISGPGIRIAGTRLVWRWAEEKATMDRPTSRIESGKAIRKEG